MSTVWLCPLLIVQVHILPPVNRKEIMIIDSYSVGKLVRLRAVLKPDEKIVARGAIFEVAKKEKWEIVVESVKKWLGRVIK